MHGACSPFVLLHRPPQCVPITNSACTAVFPQPHYIPVTGRDESKTFEIVTEISDQLDLFCSDALFVYACHFTHPPCDPENGNESCTLHIKALAYHSVVLFHSNSKSITMKYSHSKMLCVNLCTEVYLKETLILTIGICGHNYGLIIIPYINIHRKSVNSM